MFDSLNLNRFYYLSRFIETFAHSTYCKCNSRRRRVQNLQSQKSFYHTNLFTSKERCGFRLEVNAMQCAWTWTRRGYSDVLVWCIKCRTTMCPTKSSEYEAVLGGMRTERSAAELKRGSPFTSWTEQGCIARMIAIRFPFVLGMTSGC